MSSLDIPLSTANSIYNISIVVLIGGIILVLISTASLIWSGLIRERFANEKIAHDEAAAAAATAAMQKARADAEEAKKQLQLAKAAAATKLEKEKANPASTDWVITPDQHVEFKKYVQNFPKGRVFLGIASNDPETVGYAKQLSDMLSDSGYQVMPKSDLLLPPNQEFTGVHVRIKSMAQQPVYAGALQKGLEYINVDTAGELDDTAEDSVLILVGTQP